MKTISQLSQSVSALSVFLAAFYLFLLLTAATDTPAREPADPLKVAMAELAQDGVMTDAMNHLQSELGKPPVSQVQYDGDTDCFYWTGPVTGKTMSMDRVRFLEEIFSPFMVWSDLHHLNY
jgi:hypothetical protein